MTVGTGLVFSGLRRLLALIQSGNDGTVLFSRNERRRSVSFFDLWRLNFSSQVPRWPADTPFRSEPRHPRSGTWEFGI